MSAALILMETARHVAWMPPDGSLRGPIVDRLMFWNLIAIVAAAVIAHLWLTFALLRRRSSARKFPSLIRWGLVGAFCVMYAWMALTAQRLWAANRFTGPSLTAMHVEVVGEQFQWYFRYPGPDATFGATRPQLISAAEGNPLGLDAHDPDGNDDMVSSVLVLPAGREVDLQLRSLDVIHGFFIPGMRLKENAVPGLVLHLHFTPEKPGTYPILCTQVCGMGHGRMQARLMVVSPADYTVWLDKRERARQQAEGE